LLLESKSAVVAEANGIHKVERNLEDARAIMEKDRGDGNSNEVMIWLRCS
jgi:hypothetical protein